MGIFKSVLINSKFIMNLVNRRKDASPKSSSKFNKMLVIPNLKMPSIWRPHTDFLFSKTMSVVAASQYVTTQNSSGTLC